MANLYTFSINMDIYSTSADTLLFDAPYKAKELLKDSLDRTLRGYGAIFQGSILNGCADILAGRVESVAAFSLAALSGIFFGAHSTIYTIPFLLLAIPLNPLSRFSSARWLQNFNNDVVYRVLRVNLIALAVIPSFIAASAVNTFLPGALRTQSLIFKFIQKPVEPFGPLLTLRAQVPEKIEAQGTKIPLSILDTGEEYLRALSFENKIEEITVDWLRHHLIIYT